jgi:hypothetical protein
MRVDKTQFYGRFLTFRFEAHELEDRLSGIDIEENMETNYLDTPWEQLLREYSLGNMHLGDFAGFEIHSKLKFLNLNELNSVSEAMKLNNLSQLMEYLKVTLTKLNGLDSNAGKNMAHVNNGN